MRTTLLLAVAMGLGTSALRGQEPESGFGRIRIAISGLKGNTGDLRISLFNSRTGFPGKPGLASSKAVISAEGESHTYVFERIPYGTYAISVMHDENRNGKLDTNFLGIPREGGGALNNPKSRFGPPSFEDSMFVLDCPELSQEIRLR